MEWSDDAIVLSSRPHGETSAVLEVLTRDHGRHMGLVRGGASRWTKPILQPGNTLHLVWRARLTDHLGSFAAEPAKNRAGTILESREGLLGLNAFAAMVSLTMHEREVHAAVFNAGEILLDAIAEHDFADWGALYVRWEVGLLEALGFGLDLSSCAATGSMDDLIYVSPRSGRAVSRAGGAAYADRMFALPGFLVDSQNAHPSAEELREGLRLTGYFLAERVLRPHNRELPPARVRLEAFSARES
jgi:DNA repair protein RecO (recombination protein O)